MNYFDTLSFYTNDADYCNYAGLCYYYLRNYEKAINCYYKSVEINPLIRVDYYYSNIGMAYTNNHQLEKAKIAFRTFENLKIDPAKANRNWAMCYAVLGNKRGTKILQKSH
ncbi:MAG: tetratricopeptide repeat protein [Saprospiraceae bacterium]|nr:tetratricopeptide repeat protein [Saprospiraceae bacterium]